MKQTVISDIPVVWAELATTRSKKLVIWLPGFGGDKEAIMSLWTD